MLHDSRSQQPSTQKPSESSIREFYDSNAPELAEHNRPTDALSRGGVVVEELIFDKITESSCQSRPA